MNTGNNAVEGSVGCYGKLVGFIVDYTFCFSNILNAWLGKNFCSVIQGWGTGVGTGVSGAA